MRDIVFYTENYKILVKDAKKRHINLKIYSWAGILTIIKLSMLPKVIYIFNAMPMKIPKYGLLACLQK